MSHPLAESINNDIKLLKKYFDKIAEKSEKTTKLKITLGIIKQLLFPWTIDKRTKSEIAYALVDKNIVVEENNDENVVKLLMAVVEDSHEAIREVDQDLKPPATNVVVYKPSNDTIELNDSTRGSINVLKDIENVIRENNLTEYFIPILEKINQASGRESAIDILSYLKNCREELERELTFLPQYIFRLLGEFWQLKFKTELSNMKDSNGLKYLHTLLQTPNKGISSITLSELTVSRKNSISPGLSEKSDEHDYSKIIYTSDKAKNYSKAQFKSAIDNLKAKLELEHPGTSTFDKIEEQIRTLNKEMNKHYGLGGEEKIIDAGFEQSRQAVYKAIMRDYKRLTKYMPDLTIHFKRNVSTGYECIYDPPLESQFGWQLY